MGNIYDEYDEKEDYIIPNPDGRWTISGPAELKDVEKALDIELPEREEFNTLSGLILDELGHIPQTGEKLRWSTFTFEIVDMDGVRIDKILVTHDQVSES